MTHQAVIKHAHVVLDAEDEAGRGKGDPLAVKRRRGRPQGAQTRTTHAHVTADEFAFLRAVAQGIDLMVASGHYLLWPSRPPSREAHRLLLNETVTRAVSAALAIEDPEAAVHSVRLQGLLIDSSIVSQGLAVEVRTPADTLAHQAVLSLEEFATRFPEGMYSEAELIELFEEEAAQVVTSTMSEESTQSEPPQATQLASLVKATPSVQELVSAIDWISERVQVHPKREHALGQWLHLNEQQLTTLRLTGVLTLGNLIDWISLEGRRWFDRLPRYGVARARRLEAWLQRSGIKPSAGLPAVGPLGGITNTAAVAGRFLPLTEMAWPDSLKGERGTFRTNSPNLLGAKDDVEAVNAWFQLLKDNSESTQAAYQRAIERLVLWSIHEKAIELSSLTTANLVEFRDFLRAPPPHWVQMQKSPRMKGAQDWRPLRGPLNDQSLKLTFAAINAMFSTWQIKSYVTGNPATGVVRSHRKDVSLDVLRSFSSQDELTIATTFDALEEGPLKRRLLALVRLLQTAGLRRQEAEDATWEHLRLIRLNGAVSDSWALTVLGKGKRERMVPISRPTMDALRAHLQDRLDLAASGKLTLFKHVDPSKAPLIGVLDERWILAKRKFSAPVPSMPHQVDRGLNSHGGLTAPGMYSVLKAFFRKCAVSAGQDNSDFSKASAHWLRHTFAHQALQASKNDLTVVQQLLGHASITTTAIYTKADMASRVEVVNSMKPAI